MDADIDIRNLFLIQSYNTTRLVLVRSLEAGRVGRVVAEGGRGDGASARQEPRAGQLEVAGHLPITNNIRAATELREVSQCPEKVPTRHSVF